MMDNTPPCPATSLPKLPVYILAGGRSRRFGSDKARAMLAGRPLIVHLAEAARPVATAITAVAEVAGKYNDLGIDTIGDDQPGLGPLGGLATALRHAGERADWLLLLSCDLLELRTAWVTALHSAAEQGALAVAFFDRRWQPMPGLYHRRILPLVTDLLTHGEGRMWRLLETAGAVPVPTPPDWPDQLQANRPEDLPGHRS